MVRTRETPRGRTLDALAVYSFLIGTPGIRPLARLSAGLSAIPAPARGRESYIAFEPCEGPLRAAVNGFGIAALSANLGNSAQKWSQIPADVTWDDQGGAA